MLTTILAWLGNLLGGPFAAAAVDAYRARLDAENSADAHTADLVARELAVEQREAELAQQVVIAEQGNVVARLVRPLFALPFIVYAWKIVVWDKVFALGTTDPLGADMTSLMSTIVAAYFGGRTVEKVAAILRRR
jgi:hypothetical protein